MLVNPIMVCDIQTNLENHPVDGCGNTGPNECLWLQAAQAGELEAYNHLVRLYQDPLYHWALYLVDDPALAEDITQSAFLAAYQKLHTFHGGSLRAWLFKIVRNRAYDALRRNHRHPLSSLNEPLGDEDDRELLDLIPTEDVSPEDAVALSEQADLVYLLLNQLPKFFQSALVLVDLNAMEYQEAADILNIPIGTLKSRLARGRQKFRQIAMQNSLFVESLEEQLN